MIRVIPYDQDKTRVLQVNSSKAAIADPYQWVWDNDEGSISGLVRFSLDLNDDGAPEIFVSAKSLIGNGGGPFEKLCGFGPVGNCRKGQGPEQRHACHGGIPGPFDRRPGAPGG